jgi:membrane-bound lytic murein transglycosylase MltF
LAQVDEGDADYAVVTQSDFEARRAAFPQLKAAAPLRECPPRLEHCTVVMTSCLKTANAFLEQARADGTLKRLTGFYGQGAKPSIPSGCAPSITICRPVCRAIKPCF